MALQLTILSQYLVLAPLYNGMIKCKCTYERYKTYYGLVITIHVQEFLSSTLMPNFDL